ncbi:hypothetical protein EV291_15421 [Rhizobium sp. BK068]|nr:hypothetical protein EV291_15421 [Rhizobium sp. BK068]
MLTLLRTHGRYRAVFDAGSVYMIHTIAGQDLEAYRKCIFASWPPRQPTWQIIAMDKLNAVRRAS